MISLRKFLLVLAIYSVTPKYGDAAEFTVPYDANYEPLSFLNSEALPSGFDVEVARALAEIGGVSITFTAAEFLDIQNGGWPEGWGYSVSSMSRTPEREKSFSFVGPYLFDSVVVVTRSTNPIVEVSELKDVRVGVCSGCVYENFLKGEAVGVDGVPISGSIPVSFATDPDILREISDPESDLEYGITSEFHANYYIEIGAPIKKLTPELFFSPLWVVVSRGEPELREVIDAAFKKLKESGRLMNLSKAHLGEDYTSNE